MVRDVTPLVIHIDVELGACGEFEATLIGLVEIHRKKTKSSVLALSSTAVVVMTRILRTYPM